MGREIRRVPPNWQHPKKDDGQYQPMRDESYLSALNEWLAEHHKWEDGTHESRAKYPELRYYAQYDGGLPDVEYYRPDWPEGSATWYQVYETVTEGTPVSPPFATQEELIEYLVANGDLWDQQRGDGGWERKNAENFVRVAWAPSGLVVPGKGFLTAREACGEL